jgi:hypothetical protein
MEYILSSLDMFAGIGENLIGYTFNVCYELSLFLVEINLRFPGSR